MKIMKGRQPTRQVALPVGDLEAAHNILSQVLNQPLRNVPPMAISGLVKIHKALYEMVGPESAHSVSVRHLLKAHEGAVNDSTKRIDFPDAAKELSYLNAVKPLRDALETISIPIVDWVLVVPLLSAVSMSISGEYVLWPLFANSPYEEQEVAETEEVIEDTQKV